MSRWERLESKIQSVDLTGGIEARIADPLWMLSRQWQVLEFEGDDAAQPAAVRITGQNLPLNGFKGLSGDWQDLPDRAPLEAVVEAAPGPDFGAAGLYAAARASRRLFRMLALKKLVKAVDRLREEFPVQPPERMVQASPASAQAADLLARCALDAAALAAAPTARIEAALAPVLAPAEIEQAVGVIEAWKTWVRGRGGEPRSPAWDDERLEYSFSLSAGPRTGRGSGSVIVEAPEHNGGHLDWYTFDLKQAAPVEGRQPAHTALPSPIRYRGMPASRWWQFEEGTVNFGDLDAGPADLARLLVAEFATIYSNDWFVVPVPVPVGSISQIQQVQVIDNFGGRDTILSTAAYDAQRGRGSRDWRFFELTGDEVGPGHPSPWLLIPPTLPNDINGPVLERVVLARDEGANLVWAVESQVEGLLGRAVERAEAWFAAQPAETQPGPDRQPAGAAAGEAQSWRYQLETPHPAWWIPFLPERIERGSAQVRLRRARMQAWDLYQAAAVIRQVGPQGVFLDPRRPVWINEEEVPKMGVRLERRWQFGRWHDGSYHVWLQRRKFAGRGERSSGLQWDALLPGPPEKAGVEK